jgi:hypothetical protein
MTAGDVTGDGYSDLVIASGYAAADGSISNPGFYIYPWSAGSGMFGTPIVVPLSNRLICGAALLDVDADGDNDIVFVDNIMATYAFDICTLTNNGSGSFSGPSCITELGTSASMFRAVGGMALADFDRDGHMDLVVSGGLIDAASSNATSTKDVRIYRNTAPGLTLTKTISESSTVAFTSTVVGDVNDDGLLDIVTNGGSPAAVHVFNATGDFSFSDPTQLTGNQTDTYGGFYADQVTLGYLDTDTKLDILLSHTNGPSSVFFSGSSYSLSTIPNFTEQHGARFQVLDLNTDGVDDIILPYKNRLLANNTYGALWANANNITTTASPATTNSIYGSATTSSWVEGSLVFSDFDKDGKLDAVNFATYVMALEALKGH